MIEEISSKTFPKLTYYEFIPEEAKTGRPKSHDRRSQQIPTTRSAALHGIPKINRIPSEHLSMMGKTNENSISRSLSLNLFQIFLETVNRIIRLLSIVLNP